MRFIKSTTETVDKNINVYDNLDVPEDIKDDVINTKKTFNIKKYTHVRLSELATFCPREYALGYKYGKAKESYTEYPLMQQFEIGSALHFWYQNFSKVFKDVLYGNWKCWACGKLRGRDEPLFTTRDEIRKNPCEHCGASGEASFYHEYYFRIDEPYRVTGKIDGFILKDNKLHVIDFKSYFTKEDFPKLQDKAQLVGYMLFYDYLPDSLKLPLPIDLETGYLYYLSKKFSYRDSILCYAVTKEQKIADAILKNVSLFSDSVKTGILPPPFDICSRSNWLKGKAKNCFLRELCKQEYVGV
ncbi:PD-(D/E)XK nuclease family protein [Thermoanaerobacter sp. A7A]|uniref:PD-(D/E)XK nuclease family protein n=1 Tax=Thermoanaerobacter sp. A7A TaxID=1350366 RepID=UPI00041A2BA1|nr:PD-(D/E)XK nuclease family protein [Thermoanaerobacter sp. A7A]